MRRCYVYCLFRPWNCEPCYIGFGSLKDTWARHAKLGVNHYNRHLANIFRKAVRLGLEVPCVILRDGLDETTAFEYETAFIKAIGRADQGLGPLCNLTDGGEGNVGWIMPTEARAKIGKAHRGKLVSEVTRQRIKVAKVDTSAETRAKMSASASKRIRIPCSVETRAKISAVHKGRVFTAEHRANIGKASLGRAVSDEARLKIGKASKESWAHRTFSEDALAKMSAANKGKIISAAHKERLREHHLGLKASEETRAKMSAAHKTR